MRSLCADGLGRGRDRLSPDAPAVRFARVEAFEQHGSESADQLPPDDTLVQDHHHIGEVQAVDDPVALVLDIKAHIER